MTLNLFKGCGPEISFVDDAPMSFSDQTRDNLRAGLDKEKAVRPWYLQKTNSQYEMSNAYRISIFFNERIKNHKKPVVKPYGFSSMTVGDNHLILLK